MRIRTRYSLFRLIVAIAVIVFLVSLYDMFLNDSEWFIPIMIGYGALLALGLLLYIGYKPDFEEEPGLLAETVAAAPEEPGLVPEEVVEVVEVPKTRPSIPAMRVEGPHHFKCPFCANLFSLESTHLRGRHDFRMNCPYCANNIRIPKQPKVTPQDLGALSAPAPNEQVVFACTSCGEVLRFSAPGGRLDRFLHVLSCPNCRRATVVEAAI